MTIRDLFIDLEEHTTDGRVILTRFGNVMSLELDAAGAITRKRHILSRDETEQLLAALGVIVDNWDEDDDPEATIGTPTLDAITPGQKLVVTGIVPHFTRKEFSKALSAEIGGGTRVSSSGGVTAATDHLIVGSRPGGNKLSKATSLGISQIDVVELTKELGWVNSDGDLTASGMAALTDARLAISGARSTITPRLITGPPGASTVISYGIRESTLTQED